MTELPTQKTPKSGSGFAERVGAQAARKLKARNHPGPNAWLGLRMMGLIGWSIAIPPLLGAALGIWLDKRSTGDRPWTLALLMAGLALGCMNAWHWVAKEHREIDQEQRGDDE